MAALDTGRAQLDGYGAGELLAEDLRDAQQALGEITGEFSADDLLGEILAASVSGSETAKKIEKHPIKYK